MVLWKRVELLDRPIVQLNETDSLSARDLAAGTLITGMTGGGKTSGPGNTLLRGMIRAGMGGMITTAKPDDVTSIRTMCAEEGRLDSLISWDGKNGGFNFLAWTLAQQGADGMEVAIELLMRVFEMKQASAATPGGSGDQFWTDSNLQRFRATLPVLHAATGTLRVADILRFVRSAPESQEQMRDPNWQRESFFFECFARAADRIDDADGQNCMAYWIDNAKLDARTRGNLLVSFTTALYALNSGWLRQAFCEECTLFPELAFFGAIIVLDMPVLTRHEDGTFAQQIFVYCFQRAVLYRNALPNRYRERPVFLFIDEFPLFCNSQYAQFLGTCRSSRCCTVLLAQSLPAIVARMTGANAEQKAQALLANCSLKIWAANNCTITNEWAAKTIGRTLQSRANYSQNEGASSNMGLNMGTGESWGTSSQSGGSSSYGKGGGSSGSSWSSGSNSGGNDSWGRSRGTSSNHGESWGSSEVLDYAVEPGAFGRMLKTGGPTNGNRVSAIVYQAGRTFASGTNALVAEFRQ